MSDIRDALHVQVEYNTEDLDYGPVYIATFAEIAAVTDGKTWEELLKNIREVVALHLEDEDTAKDFQLVSDPRIIITMELPKDYAETA